MEVAAGSNIRLAISATVPELLPCKEIYSRAPSWSVTKNQKRGPRDLAGEILRGGSESGAPGFLLEAIVFFIDFYC